MKLAKTEDGPGRRRKFTIFDLARVHELSEWPGRDVKR